MHEQQTTFAEYFPTNMAFEKLTSADSIAAEHYDAALALAQLSDEAIADKDANIMALQRKYSGESPKDLQRRRELREEQENLDYLAGHYRHRARMRKYEMERNPHELWLDASDSEKVRPVKEMVEKSPRMADQHFTTYVPPVYEGRPKIVVEGDSSYHLSVPTSNLIYAEGFVSWEEGRPGEKMRDKVLEGRDKTTSRELIDDYATRDTPIPPVDYVTGFVQPNGLIVYAVTGGAHRAAAAIKRGEEMLPVRQLQLVETDYDIVSLDETDAR